MDSGEGPRDDISFSRVVHDSQHRLVEVFEIPNPFKKSPRKSVRRRRPYSYVLSLAGCENVYTKATRLPFRLPERMRNYLAPARVSLSHSSAQI